MGTNEERPGYVSNIASATSNYDQTKPGNSEMPHPVYHNESGSSVLGMPFIDGYSTGRPQLVGVLSQAITNIFGTVTGGTVNQSETLFQTWASHLGDMVYAKAATKGLSITNYNVTTTFNVSFMGLMATITDVIRNLYGMRCLSKLYGYNETCSSIAMNINQRLPEIDARVNRLRSLFLPKAYVEAVEYMHGVFISGLDSDAPFFDCPLFGTQAQSNIAVLANIDNMLAGIDSQFSAIFSTPSADVANWVRVMSYLYEPIEIGEGKIVQDMQRYNMMFARALTYADAATLYTAPTMTALPSLPLVPFWLFGDVTALSPQWGTLMRHAFAWSNTAIANASLTHPIGMFDTDQGNAGVTGSPNILSYSSGVTFKNVATTDLVGVGIKVITASIGAEFDYPWAPFALAEVTAANQLNNDSRTMRGWSMYYVPLGDICNNTIVFWHDLFGL